MQTPLHLYRNAFYCLKTKDMESAAYSSALAGAFVRYDMLRVGGLQVSFLPTALFGDVRDALTEDEQGELLAASYEISMDEVK